MGEKKNDTANVISEFQKSTDAIHEDNRNIRKKVDSSLREDKSIEKDETTKPTKNNHKKSLFFSQAKGLADNNIQKNEVNPEPEKDSTTADNKIRKAGSDVGARNHGKVSTVGDQIKRTPSADNIYMNRKGHYDSRIGRRLAKKRKWYDRGIIGHAKESFKNVKRKISSIGKSSVEKFRAQEKRFLIYTIANYVYEPDQGISKMSWENWRSCFADGLDELTNFAISNCPPSTNGLIEAARDAESLGSSVRSSLVWWVRNVVGHVYREHKNDLDKVEGCVSEINENLIKSLSELTSLDILVACEQDGMAVLKTHSGGSSDLTLSAHYNSILNSIQEWLKQSMEGEEFGDFVYEFIVAYLSERLKSHNEIVRNIRIYSRDKVTFDGISRILKRLKKALSSSVFSELENRLKVSLTGGRACTTSLDALAMYFIMVSDFKPKDMSIRWKDYLSWDDLFRSKSFPLHDKKWVEFLKNAWYENNISKAKTQGALRAENLNKFPRPVIDENIKVTGSMMSSSSNVSGTQTANDGKNTKYYPISAKPLQWAFQDVLNYSDSDKAKEDKMLVGLQDNQRDFQNHIGYCVELAKTPISYYNYVTGNGVRDEKGNLVSDVTSIKFWKGKGAEKADVNNYCNGFGKLLDEELNKYEVFVNNIYKKNADTKMLPDDVDKDALSKSYKQLKECALKKLNEIKEIGLRELKSLAQRDELKNCFITDIGTRINKNVKWNNVFKFIGEGSMDSAALEALDLKNSGSPFTCVRDFITKVISEGTKIITDSAKKDLPAVTSSLTDSMNNLKKSFLNSISKGFLGKKSSDDEKADVKEFCNGTLVTNLK
jgi:hypothetical protein